MGGPGYTEYAPDPRLAPYVAVYWSSDVPPGADASHAVLPDGCIDLLFESHTAQLSVVGTMTRALWVAGCGPAGFVGVRFRPGGAVPFLRERADLLTDEQADSPALLGRAGRLLAEQLVDGATARARVRLLERFLLDRLARGVSAVEPRIAWAAARLGEIPGTRVGAVAAELGVSRQYIRRLFLHQTGVSPKVFARIMRLRALVGAMAGARSLAELALDAGYADQAHMSNEFRELVGTTPRAYRPRVSIPTRPD